MQTRNILFTFVLIFILIIPSIHIVFAKDKTVFSELEKRYLSQFSDLSLSNFLDGKFQNSMENTIADRFLLREYWLKSKIHIDRNLRFLVSTFFESFNNKHHLLQIITGDIALVKGSQYLIKLPHKYDVRNEESIIENIDKINRLNERYKDIKIYVYIPTQPQDTNIFSLYSYGENYLELFKRLNVPFSMLRIEKLSDFQQMYFKTDHHWNHIGAYKGYVDIINLLFDGKEQPYIPIDEIVFHHIKFYGSLSRKIAFSMDVEADDIGKYLFKLPEYKLYIDGDIVGEYGNLKKFMGNEIDTTKGFDHYNYLYQQRRSIIIFDTQRNDRENILVISDSMSNPIRDVIAAHFNKSIFINLDCYTTEIGIFDIDKYIKQYDINKILFMVVLENYFQNGEMKNFKVK